MAKVSRIFASWWCIFGNCVCMANNEYWLDAGSNTWIKLILAVARCGYNLLLQRRKLKYVYTGRS